MKFLFTLVLTALLVILGQQVTATNLWSMSRRTAGDNRKNVVPDDLTSLIVAPCGAKSKEHAKAMELLESMQSAPTCNKLATSNLLSSCQSIESSARNQGPSLEGVKAVYAAQLALCELRNVGAEPPEKCRSIAFDSGKIDVDIHSDEMLEIMKRMLSTSSKVDEAFVHVFRKANDDMEQQQRFASAVHTFQEQLVRDLETTSQSGQNYISSLTAALGASLRSMLQALTFASEDIQINVNELSRNLKATSEHSSSINKSVTDIFQQMLYSSSELAVLRNNELEASKALSLDLQQSLRLMRDEDVVGIFDSMRDLHHNLRLSNDLLANNSAMLREHVTSSQVLEAPTRIVNSVSRWTWLILTVFALWVYDPRAGALLTVTTIGFIKLVDVISPDQCDVVMLQLTPSLGITLIDLFQGLGIVLCLAFPVARACGFVRRGGKGANAFLGSGRAKHHCTCCKEAVSSSPDASKVNGVLA